MVHYFGVQCYLLGGGGRRRCTRIVVYCVVVAIGLGRLIVVVVSLLALGSAANERIAVLVVYTVRFAPVI